MRLILRSKSAKMTVNKKGPELLRAIAYGEELSVPHRVTSKMLTIDVFLPSSYSGKRYFTDPYAYGQSPENRISGCLLPSATGDLKRSMILEKGRKGNLARDTALYLARDLTKESARILGAYFGGISGAGITMRYKHMSQEAAKSRRLTARLKKLRGLIVNI